MALCKLKQNVPSYLVNAQSPSSPDYAFDSCAEEIAQKLVQGVVRQAHAHDRSLPVPQHVPVGQQEPDDLCSHERLRVISGMDDDASHREKWGEKRRAECRL